MNWQTAAMISPLVFLAYQLLIDFVPMFPWNDTSTRTIKHRLLEVVFNYTPLLLIAYGFSQTNRTGWLIASIGATLYFFGHLNAWWKPYFFGASAKEMEEYKTHFSRTWKFLPARGTNPIPDAEHVVIGIICIAMVASTWAAYLAL
jgi:hypothetical protein